MAELSPIPEPPEGFKVILKPTMVTGGNNLRPADPAVVVTKGIWIDPVENDVYSVTYNGVTYENQVVKSFQIDDNYSIVGFGNIDGVKYSGLTPWYATTEDEGEEYRAVGLGNPIYSRYNPEGVTSDLSFAVVTDNFNANGIGATTGGEHTAIVEEVGGSGSPMTVTYTLEFIEPQPDHDQDLDIDAYYNIDEVFDLFKVDPDMTYLVTFNGVAKELHLAPIPGEDGSYTLGSIATDNFTIWIWKMQDSDSYNFVMEIPASIWMDHTVPTDFIAEVSYEA